MKSPTQNVCQVENSVRGKPQRKMAAPHITHTTRNETQKSIKIITRHVDLSGEQTLLKNPKKKKYRNSTVWVWQKSIAPKKKKENKATAANKMKNAGAKILQLK